MIYIVFSCVLRNSVTHFIVSSTFNGHIIPFPRAVYQYSTKLRKLEIKFLYWTGTKFHVAQVLSHMALLSVLGAGMLLEPLCQVLVSNSLLLTEPLYTALCL